MKQLDCKTAWRHKMCFMIVCKPCLKHDTRQTQAAVFNYTDIRKPLIRALIDMSTSVACVNIQINLTYKPFINCHIWWRNAHAPRGDLWLEVCFCSTIWPLVPLRSRPAVTFGATQRLLIRWSEYAISWRNVVSHAVRDIPWRLALQMSNGFVINPKLTVNMC